MMVYAPKCIKKPKTKRKNKCRRANNHKNKLKSKLNSKFHNRVPFLMNKINNSTMAAESFWKNYEISQKWLQKHNIVWWKSKCIALENENRILRAKLRNLTESMNSEYYPQTSDQNYDYTSTDAYQYDENNYDSTKNDACQYDENNYDYPNSSDYQYGQNNYNSAQDDAYQYDENNYDLTNTDASHYNEDNYEPANNGDEDCGEEAENDEDDLVFEVDENMMKFLEQNFRYKMKLKQGQTNSSIPCNGEENDTEDLAQGPSASNNNPEVDNADLLYGSASSCIMKLEKSLRISADQFKNSPKPHYWPNIPLH